jgi:uncharacterized GH25 family protein
MREKWYRIIGIVWATALFFPLALSAHSFWINATDYAPLYVRDHAETKIYLGFGHRYPVDDFLSAENLKEFVLIGPESVKTMAPSTGGAFLASDLHFEKPGAYIVAAAKKAGFYTMYLEDGVIHHKLGPKTGLKRVILSNYHEQYAKSLINVGSSNGDSFSRQAGHKLEIIPMENPYLLKGQGGDFLTVRVLFDGKPARFCLVYATYAGFSSGDDFAFATTADSAGVAKIRLLHWGNWLIKAQVKRPATGELADKCNEQSYSATLTFEIL